MAQDSYTRRNRPAAIALVVAVLSACAWFAVYLPIREMQKPVTEREQAEFDAQMNLTNESLQGMLSEQLSSTRLARERARENDETGQALSIRCIQWTDMLTSRPSAEVERQQEYACRRFNHYVTTGEVLPEPTVTEM